MMKGQLEVDRQIAAVGIKPVSVFLVPAKGSFTHMTFIQFWIFLSRFWDIDNIAMDNPPHCEHFLLELILYWRKSPLLNSGQYALWIIQGNQDIVSEKLLLL